MKIKTSYDCTFERKDFVHLAHGRNLSATLSDGSVAFNFNMDDEIRQALQGGQFVNGANGAKPVGRIGRPPLLLGDGTSKQKSGKSYLKKGVCPHCKKGPLLLEPHIRVKHPGQPLNPTGKIRCTKCIERFDTEGGLRNHMGGPRHNPKHAKFKGWAKNEAKK